MAKIIYISFGYEPYWSGGMVDNQSSLMTNMSKIGHDITFFTAMRYDYRLRTYLERKKIKGIKTIEMVNSPNPYDPYCYRSNPTQHCNHEEIERLTQKIIDLIHPDIVHIGDLRMHCASVIEIVNNAGIPIVKTIENFWDLCPKSDLLLNDEIPCFDYKDGEYCKICLAQYSQLKIPNIHRIKGSIHYEKIFPFVSKFKNLKRYFIGYKTKNLFACGATYPSIKYHQRRQFFIETLNKCNRIHVTSENTKNRLVIYGVNPQIIVTIPLSTDSISLVIAKSDYKPHYPLIFGYRGKVHTRKGIQILLNAFSRLDQTKCKLLIYGDGDISLLAPYLQQKLNIDYRGIYHKNKINKVLSEIDVGVVPSICEETFGIVGLEYINARIPIIGSDLGGIKEWLINGENGFLFKPDNSNELYHTMNRFVENQELISNLQQKIKRWKSMATYAQEISTLYSKLISID
jgi:glycosyltransferase involved in cell wall biosynthesis